ncbi:MAG: Tol-Pal system beta propeller repeat protein TolB [Gammaproteobacteria bacterium]|nr:MAG: Tol-Pal system beta propeller repeat protein TolB [Gammaproteobacteria bacterium]
MNNWTRMNRWTRKIKSSFIAVPVLLGAVLFGAANVVAEPVSITITEGLYSPHPIAVAPFVWEGIGKRPTVDVAAVISEDLKRSGVFAPISQKEFLNDPTFGGGVRFKVWRTMGADSLVLGRIIPEGKNGLRIEFDLFDVYKGKLLSDSYVPIADRSLLRNASHHIADYIYETITGRRGVFNTQIAYVKASQDKKGSTKGGSGKGKPAKKLYELIVADADGGYPQTIMSSRDPLMSPVWSPKNRKIAYVSFEGGKSQIYVQSVETGERKKIRSFDGVNGAPAWSPDGKTLALVLSKDGDPEIYLLNIASDQLLRLTFSRGIDTEPVWTPDGRFVVFTSDRGGTPQLYRVPVTGGKVKRLTYEGRYNSRAVFSPEGRYMAFVHRDEQNRYRIAVKDMHTEEMQLVTDGPLDEAPSFSPNGDMILFAAKGKEKMVLKTVGRNGLAETSIFTDGTKMIEGDFRQPSWAPFE